MPDVLSLTELIYRIDRALLKTGANGEKAQLDQARKDFAIELMSTELALRKRFGSWLENRNG